MKARCVMVWGTTSDAGKSTVVAALARILVRRGLCVAPFKAQNMARNAYVCADGGEIGVAQAVQARAARVEPCTDHNPILLKPEPGMVSQVILDGRSIGRHRYGEYGEMAARMRISVESALGRLREANDVVVLEGAGSPAEINLAARDLANLEAARMADAEIVLVADIDRGGVFASILGTLALVPDDLRPRVRGVIINKLRGDASLLDSGIRAIEALTGVPILGVVPHLGDLSLPDEDSLSLARWREVPRARLGEFEITVVDTPALANIEDVLPFTTDPGVVVRLSIAARDLVETDLLVLAGSKNTVHDLEFLRATGLDAAVSRRAAQGKPILAICGGAQILGTSILDPLAIESETPWMAGLGLVPVRTEFQAAKRAVQLEGQLCIGAVSPRVRGFHLHHGRLLVASECAPLLRLADGTPEGVVHGSIACTMLHRLVDEPAARHTLLAWAGHVASHTGQRAAPDVVDPYDRLADAVAASLDLESLFSYLHGDTQ